MPLHYGAYSLFPTWWPVSAVIVSLVMWYSCPAVTDLRPFRVMMMMYGCLCSGVLWSLWTLLLNLCLSCCYLTAPQRAAVCSLDGRPRRSSSRQQRAVNGLTEQSTPWPPPPLPTRHRLVGDNPPSKRTKWIMTTKTQLPPPALAFMPRFMKTFPSLLMFWIKAALFN